VKVVFFVVFFVCFLFCSSFAFTTSVSSGGIMLLPDTQTQQEPNVSTAKLPQSPV